MWRSIDIDCILLHVKFEIRLSISVSRNKSTLYKKLVFKTDEFAKVHKFQKCPSVLLTRKEILCLHMFTVTP